MAPEPERTAKFLHQDLRRWCSWLVKIQITSSRKRKREGALETRLSPISFSVSLGFPRSLCRVAAILENPKTLGTIEVVLLSSFLTEFKGWKRVLGERWIRSTSNLKMETTTGIPRSSVLWAFRSRRLSNKLNKLTSKLAELASFSDWLTRMGKLFLYLTRVCQTR